MASPFYREMLTFCAFIQSIHTSSALGAYSMVMKFHGGPVLSRMLRIESSILASCSPDIIVNGCELEGDFFFFISFLMITYSFV